MLSLRNATRKSLSLTLALLLAFSLVLIPPSGKPEATAVTIPEVQSSTYQIRNAASGKYLDADHSGTEAGTNLLTFPGTAGKTNQMWTVVKLDNGNYVLRYKINTDLGVGVSADGTKVNLRTLWKNNNTKSLTSAAVKDICQWEIKRQNDGTIMLHSASDPTAGKMERYADGDNNGDGGIVCWYGHANINQRWILEDAGIVNFKYVIDEDLVYNKVFRYSYESNFPYKTQVDGAAAVWNEAAGSNVCYRVASNATQPDPQVTKMLSYSNINDGTYAITGMGGTIKFNTATMSDFSNESNSNIRDALLKEIAVHEFGHALRLGHAGDMGNTMYKRGYVSYQTLSLRDRASLETAKKLW